jgi:EAL and modified HD-GYP domain-containing signal transduction protein
VAILGQKEVRRWATVAISVSLAEDRPGEITKLSLVRAKFAENLALAFELGIFQSNLFMAGLFSLLDVVLEKPMAEAVKEVAVDDRVKKALVDKTGELYTVLDLIYTYERADWDKVSIIGIRNNVDMEMVIQAFLDALVWYNQLLASIDESDKE